MIDKFLALMTFVLFYSFTNHYALRCRTISKEAGTLQFHCSAGYSFEKCERLFVESRNVTKVIILECEVNKFPTELFGPYQNLKGLEIHNPTLHNLSQDNFIGANQLEDLSITGGEFNISASIFVNAPKLKAFSIHYTDVTYIDPQAFNNASALKTLILTIQSNETWPEGLFDSLTNLQVLDLHRDQYSDLHDKEIDINNLRIPVGNTIKLFKFVGAGDVVELKAETFVNLTQLTMLLFGGNSIERIWPYTFVRMNQLILLDLRGNKIQELTQTMLAGLINLRTADFAFNDIRYIESGAFSSTPQLRRLDLSYNEITTLEPHTLNSLLKISHLDLSRIYIKDEPCTVDLSLFCNQPNLSYLNLGYKGISKLKKCTQSGISGPLDSTLEETLLNTTAELLPEWQYLESKEYIWDKIVDWAYVDGLDHIREFSGLLNERQNTSAGSRLTILNLSWNGLSDWEDNLFDTLANLRILDLERNPIESLRPAQFNGLGNLLILRLNSCQLTSLDFNAFSSLTNLKKLYLVHNRIQTITPPGRPMYQLTYLELSENGLNSTSLDLDAFRKSFDLNKLLVALGSRFK